MTFLQLPGLMWCWTVKQ